MADSFSGPAFPGTRSILDHVMTNNPSRRKFGNQLCYYDPVQAETPISFHSLFVCSYNDIFLFPIIPGYWYNFILYGSCASGASLFVLIICILTAIKQHQNKKRHRRQVVNSSLSRGDSETPHQHVDCTELAENNRFGGEARAPLMTSSSVSCRTDRLGVSNEERITDRSHFDHRPSASAGRPYSPISEVPHSPVSGEQPYSSISREQPQHPVPSAPPDSTVDSQEPTPFDIAPSSVDLQPATSPSAPPEYDIFHELDRFAFIPQDNHNMSRSNSNDAVIDPSLLDTTELFGARLSLSSNIPSGISVPSSEPPSRDPPPEYDEFIENQNQYGFVSETGQPDTPPPEYQLPPSVLQVDASETGGPTSETITEV